MAKAYEIINTNMTLSLSAQAGLAFGQRWVWVPLV